MENLIQNVTFLLSAIGVLAFFVSIITQVIKGNAVSETVTN